MWQYPVEAGGGGGGGGGGDFVHAVVARRGLCVRGAVVFPAAALVISASRVRGGMHNALPY